MSDFEQRIASLEGKNRRLFRFVLVILAFTVVGVVWNATPAQSKQAELDDGILRISMLEIVDETGTVRARVGSNLPDAIIDGRRIGRGGEVVSGIMLYDATGQERGGYVTFEPSGNIGLTLDTRKGQVALLAAGPESGANLRLWHEDDAIELRSDADGSRLTVVDDRTISLQLPPVSSIEGEACSAYRSSAQDFSVDRVLEICSERFPSSLCQQCLGQ